MKNKNLLRTPRRIAFGIVLTWTVTGASAQSKMDAGWPNYGNDAGSTRYSFAIQIDRAGANAKQY